MTTPDISPEAVERMASIIVKPLSTLKESAEAAAMLRALRSALTASGEALQKYGRHTYTCFTLDHMAGPELRTCTCGFDAAMEKANV